MANQFYVEPAQFGQGLSALSGSVQQFGQQRQAQQQAEAQKAYEQQAKQAVASALQSGDPRMMQQVSVQFPEVAESMRQAYGFTNDLTEQAAKAGYRKFLGSQDPAERLAILEGTVDTIAELGGRPVISQQDVERFKRDPEGTAKSIEMAYAGIDPDGYEALMGSSQSDVPAPSNVREYEYYNSLSPEEQRQYLTMKRASQTYRSGDVQMTTDPIAPTQASPVTEAGQRPTTQSEEQQRLTEQEAEKQASIKAAEQAIALSNDAFKRLEPVKTAIANYDEAIDLVDRQGANTGVIASKFPSIQQASIKLDNLQGRLGLDVIGNTTFGALSESELRFALDTALPKNLKGPELVKWLKKKKQTQQKLAGYLEEAAIYLGTPGNTVASFLEEKKAKSKSANQAPAPALDYLMQNPDQIDAFEEKYGYRPEGF